MPLISQSIPSFKGGVSQQPDILKYPDQLEEQLNCLSDPVAGLQKRPPTVHVKRIRDAAISDNVFVHFIDRDANERYIVLVHSESGYIEVYNTYDGAQKVVHIPEASRSYLLAPGAPAHATYSAITIADYTIIVNKSVIVRMDTNRRSPSRSPEALFYVKGGDYGKSFEIYINGEKKAEYTIPDGSETWHVNTTRAQNIITELSNKLTTNQVAHTASSSYIAIPLNSWADNIVAADGYGNQYMYCFKNQLSSTTKLPPEAPHGYMVEIVGQGTTADDNYWLRYDGTKNNWIECAAPGILTDIQWGTMPHALIRRADGEFEFTNLSWASRLTGDDKTNAIPSFADQQISDLFFFRNRLGILSGESVVLSKSADFFNFWFDSGSAVKDTDPIDVMVSSNKVINLTHAVPISNELLLFADGQQFILKADGVLTPKSVRVDTTTAFTYDAACRPLSLGRDVYFPAKKAEYSSIFRYYVMDTATEIKNAVEVTAHCPCYIPNGVFNIVGHTGESLMLCQSYGDRTCLWVFKYVLTDSGFLQQSWSKWSMGAHNVILGIQFVDDELVFVLKRDDGIHLEKMKFAGSTKDMGAEPIRLYMDSKRFAYIPETWTLGGTTTVPAYNPMTNTTDVYLSELYYGHTPKSGKYVCVLTDWGIVSDAIYREDYEKDYGKISFHGNWVGTPIMVGNVYDMVVGVSKYMIKQSNDSGGVVAETEGRLQLRNGWFNHSHSGPYDVTVSTSRGIFKYVSTPRTLGTVDNVLGSLPVTDGTIKFPIQNLNTDTKITISSTGVTPVTIVSGGWEGLYNRRNQRI